MYLLVTGGVTDKRHEELFNFSESIWFNISEELKELLIGALVVEPRDRSSISELMGTEFIQLAQEQD